MRKFAINHIKLSKTGRMNTKKLFALLILSMFMSVPAWCATYYINTWSGQPIWMIPAIPGPTSALTATADAAAGNPNGTYNYCVTFVNAAGESDFGILNEIGVSEAVTVSSKKINLTSIPVGPAGTTARKIYRSLGTGSGFPWIDKGFFHRYLTTISDNTTTTYQDNIADGDLGAAYAPVTNTTGSGMLFAPDGSKTFEVDYAKTFVGYKAGNITAGLWNTFIGNSAGALTTGGYDNVAVGDSSMGVNTTGHTNTALGNMSMSSNTTGYSNTAVGDFAAASNTEGAINVDIGFYAGWKRTTGNGNINIGSHSGEGGVTGNNNLLIGTYAGATSNPTYNSVMIGPYSGYSNTNGTSHVMIGDHAGYYETGDKKLYIDNAQRASEADGRAKALIYGVFADTTPEQRVNVNGNFGIAEKLSSKNTAAAPSPTGCTLATGSSDSFGKATVASGSSCVVTFSNAYNAAPSCTAGGSVAVTWTTSNTALTIGGTFSSSVIDYHCVGLGE